MKRFLIAILVISVSIALISSCGDSVTAGDLVITWTSPGDDGSTGTATEYDIRYSDSLITEANWDLATQGDGEPTPLIAGTTQNYTFALLPEGDYFVAMKTRDEVFNWSGLSNVILVAVDHIAPASIIDLR